MRDLLGHFPGGAQTAVDEDVGLAIGRLARRQEMSRVAIWHHMEKLRAEGFHSRPGRRASATAGFRPRGLHAA